MTKRRTRKDKEAANYSYLTTGFKSGGYKPTVSISWSKGPTTSSGSKNKPDERDVKGQFETSEKEALKLVKNKKNTDNLVKGPTLASQKKDIIKSLLLASFILSLEVVVYLLS